MLLKLLLLSLLRWPFARTTLVLCCSQSAIQDALFNALEEVIFLEQGTYSGECGLVIPSNKSVALLGGPSVIACSGNRTALHTEYNLRGVSLSNVTFTSLSNSRGVESQNSTLTLVSCTFVGWGTAVFAFGGQLSISASNFTSNFPPLLNGTVHIVGATTVVSYTSFSLNKLPIRGYQATITVIGSTFWANQGKSGGALQIFGGRIIISASTFVNNSAVEGGAIYADYDIAAFIILDLNVVSVNSSSFLNNTALNRGGAITMGGFSTTLFGFDFPSILDSTFRFNRALGFSNSSGGALYIDYLFEAFIVGNIFEFNTASQGGAILIGASASYQIRSGRFQNNVAIAGDGGAIRDRSTFAQAMRGVLFVNNTVPPERDGSVFAGEKLAVAYFDSCDFRNNTFSRSTANFAAAACYSHFSGNQAQYGLILTGQPTGTDCNYFSNVNFELNYFTIAYIDTNPYVQATSTIAYQWEFSDVHITQGIGGPLPVGIWIHLGSPVTVILQNVTITNLRIGLQTSGANIAISNSTLSGNARGILVETCTNPTLTMSITASYISGSQLGAFTVAEDLTCSSLSLLIQGSTFVYNSGFNASGAITVGSSILFLHISNSTFIGNCAKNAAGGAVSIAANTVNIYDSVFEQNSAFFTDGTPQYGGAVTLGSGGLFNVGNCTFAHNSAGYGGGLFMSSSDGVSKSFAGVRFLSNRALWGGGLYADQRAPILLDASMAIDNVGGAIYSTGPLLITNAVISNNSVQAAVIAASVGARCVIFSSNNASESSGGALSLTTDGVSTLFNCIFHNNSAGLFGGSIFADYRVSVKMSNVSFTYGQASVGGCIFMFYAALAIQCNDCTFANCYASQDGGAVYLLAGGLNIQFNSTSFIQNRAGARGGAFWSQSAVTFRDVHFSQNSAWQQGGAIWATSGLRFAKGNITDNVASEGGGVYCSSCSMSFEESVALRFNTATDGAAFWCQTGASIDMSRDTVVTNNTEIVNPHLGARCECGCCATPSTPLNVSGVDCVLYDGRPCDYFCEIGYNKTTPTFTCDNSHGASLVPLQPCEAIHCDVFDMPLHATRDGSQDPSFPRTGDTFAVTCALGYNTIGNDTFYCLGPHLIPSVPPVCEPVECDYLSAPTNGNITSHTGTYGTNVTFSCDDGYTLDGDATARCDVAADPTKGRWTSVPPKCTQQTCNPIPNPLNGTYFQPAAPKTGDTVLLTCDDLFRVVGNQSLTCRGQNVWSHPFPSCKPILCGDLDPPLNGSVIYNDTVATYACDVGFVLAGVTVRTCDHTWSDAAPICAPFVCAGVAGAADLASDCPSPVPFNATCAVWCAAGTSSAEPILNVTCEQGVNGDGLKPGLPACLPCGDGNYSSSVSQVCTVCPNGGTTGQLRATKQADCLCRPNYYEKTPGAGDCEACVAGGFCPGGKQQPVSAPGFYGGDLNFIECFPLEACTGNNTCAFGYEGARCGVCATHFYRLNANCYPCPKNGEWRIVIIVIVAVAAAAGLVFLVRPDPISERSRNFVSTTIGLSFVQIVSTFAKLRTKWPTSTTNFMDFSSTFNFNIEVTAPECYFDVTYYSKFQFQLILPIIVLGVFALAYGFTIAVIWVRAKMPPIRSLIPEARKFIELTFAAYVFFLTVAYLNLAQAAFSVMACFPLPDGRVTIGVSPEDECSGSVWRRNVGFGIFSILIYVVGIPIGVHVLYYRARTRFGVHVARESLYSNFLVQKWADRTWFWENMVMLRKLLIVCVSSFMRENAYLQVATCCVISLAALLIALVFKPYRWHRHNIVDNLLLFCQLTILFCGLLAVNPQASPTQYVMADLFSVLSIIVAVCAVVVCFGFEISIYCRIKKTSGKIKSEEVDKTSIVPGTILGLSEVSSTTILISDDGVLVVMRGTDELLQQDVATDVRRVVQCDNHIALLLEHEVHIWTINGANAPSLCTIPLTQRVRTLAFSEAGLFLGCEMGPVLLYRLQHVEGPALGQSDAGIAPEDVKLDDDSPGIPPPLPPEMSHIQDVIERAPAPVARLSQAPGAHAEFVFVRAFEHKATPVTALHAGAMFFYAAGEDSSVVKWAIESAQVVREWNVKHVLSHLALADGCVYGACENMIVALDTKMNRIQYGLWHSAPITTLLAVDDKLISASADHAIIVSDLRTHKYLQTVPGRGVGGTTIHALAYHHVTNAVLWSDTSGLLKSFKVHDEWHVTDQEVNLSYVTKPINDRIEAVKRNKARRRAPTEAIELSSADGGAAYAEMQLLADEFALPTVGWESLEGPSVSTIVAAFKAERAQRLGEAPADGTIFRA